MKNQVEVIIKNIKIEFPKNNENGGGQGTGNNGNNGGGSSGGSTTTVTRPPTGVRPTENLYNA